MNPPDPRLLRICEAYTRAALEKNVSAFLALYHPTTRVFDTWGAWSFEGVEARRKGIEQWFGSLGEERVAVTFDRVQTIVTADLASLTARVVYAAIDSQGRRTAQHAEPADLDPQTRRRFVADHPRTYLGADRAGPAGPAGPGVMRAET